MNGLKEIIKQKLNRLMEEGWMDILIIKKILKKKA